MPENHFMWLIPTPTPIGLIGNSILCVCVLGWTYCGNMCKCMCVCAPAYLWIWQWGRKIWDLESPPIIGKLKVWLVTYICLLGFIVLIKICIKTGSWTRDGFGDLIMHGEGVRHPTTTVNRQLPPSMCSFVCLIKQNVGLLLGTNVPMLSSVHQLVMHVFDAIGFVILCSPCISLGFLVK